jgi:hypothetical protein
MKFFINTFMPSAILSFGANVILQFTLLVTMWTIRMNLFRWILFSFTCWSALFIAHLIILEISKKFKPKP